MKRIPPSDSMRSLLRAAQKVARDVSADAILLLAEVPFNFKAIDDELGGVRLVVATEKPDVQRAVQEDDISLVPMLHEPQTRQLQLSQALLEAIADDFFRPGARVVCLYSLFERETVDSLSAVNLVEHLSKLTGRDLRRLETTVPLETLRTVVDLAVEIGREGREGKPVGTLFAVGNERQVMKLSHEQVHDPFRGYNRRERLIRNPRVQESIKELAQIDGAFIISTDGVVMGAGRHLDAPAQALTLSKGLGSRHWAAAAMSKRTGAITIAVSESTGTVRIFQDGYVVLRIEPLERGLKWSHLETEPPPVED